MTPPHDHALPGTELARASAPNQAAANGAPDGEALRLRRRSARDLIAAAAVVVCGGLLFVSTDSAERLTAAVLRWEAVEFDDLLLTLGLAVAVAGWFSFRRWRDSMAQIARLQRSAEERAFYLRRLEELSIQLLSTEERERNRLAELLHDEVGQTLYACRLKLELLSGTARDPAERALIAEAAELTSSALKHARDLSVQLSPPELHDLGLADAIERLLSRLSARYGLELALSPGAAWDRISRACYGAIFHSVGELVLNAAKHAGASRVVLSAEADPDGAVRVIVADDGVGFDRAATSGRGFGLFSIERRMACLRGSLDIQSAPGRGTTATLRLPAGG